MAAFRAELKVRFGDIDHAGIVYYPRFLHYFHVALEEFFDRRLGIAYQEVIDRRRLGLPTVHLEIDFRRPLRFGDRIDVEVLVEELGKTSIGWLYRVVRPGDGAVAAVARIVTVCLDMETFSKSQVPPWLRSALEEYRTACPDAGAD